MMLKVIGICVLLLAIFMVSVELTKKRGERLALCEELYRFISHVRLQIGCFLRPVPELVSGFESSLLSECGFLKELGEGKSLLDAYKTSGAMRRLSTEEDRILRSLFSSLGSGYMSDEIKLIDSHSQEFYRLVEKERADAPRETRLIKTLTAAASLGIVILLI